MIGRFVCAKGVGPKYGKFWQFNVIEDGFRFAAMFERSEQREDLWVRVK